MMWSRCVGEEGASVRDGRQLIGGQPRQARSATAALRLKIVHNRSVQPLPSGAAPHSIEITAARSRPDEPLAAIEQGIQAPAPGGL
jgi:hypothetical protein